MTKADFGVNIGHAIAGLGIVPDLVRKDTELAIIGVECHGVPAGRVTVRATERQSGILVVGPGTTYAGIGNHDAMLNNCRAFRWVLNKASMSRRHRWMVQDRCSVTLAYRSLLYCPECNAWKQEPMWSDEILRMSFNASGAKARSWAKDNFMLCRRSGVAVRPVKAPQPVEQPAPVEAEADVILEDGEMTGTGIAEELMAAAPAPAVAPEHDPVLMSGGDAAPLPEPKQHRLMQFALRTTMFPCRRQNCARCNPELSMLKLDDVKRGTICDPVFADREDARLDDLKATWLAVDHSPDDAILPNVYGVYRFGAAPTATWDPETSAEQEIERRYNACTCATCMLVPFPAPPFPAPETPGQVDANAKAHVQEVRRRNCIKRTIRPFAQVKARQSKDTNSGLIRLIMSAQPGFRTGWVNRETLYDGHGLGYKRRLLRRPKGHRDLV